MWVWQQLNLTEKTSATHQLLHKSCSDSNDCTTIYNHLHMYTAGWSRASGVNEIAVRRMVQDNSTTVLW